MLATDARDEADAVTLQTNQLVVNAVKGDPNFTAARQRSSADRRNGQSFRRFHFLAIFPQKWKLLPINPVFQIR
jgi:hypothetical protein